MKVNMRIIFKLYRPRSQNEILEKRGAPSPRTSVKAQPLHPASPPPTKEKVHGLCRFQCVYTVETSGRRLTTEGQGSLVSTFVRLSLHPAQTLQCWAPSQASSGAHGRPQTYDDHEQTTGRTVHPGEGEYGHTLATGAVSL